MINEEEVRRGIAVEFDSETLASGATLEYGDPESGSPAVRSADEFQVVCLAGSLEWRAEDEDGNVYGVGVTLQADESDSYVFHHRGHRSIPVPERVVVEALEADTEVKVFRR